MASASSPDLDITQDGNKFHLKLHSLVMTKESDFTVDEEFEETQQNGAVMKVFVSFVRGIKYATSCLMKAAPNGPMHTAHGIHCMCHRRFQQRDRQTDRHHDRKHQ